MAEVTVAPAGPGWVALCSVHGVLPAVWSSPAIAGFDALGHAAHHHAAAVSPR